MLQSSGAWPSQSSFSLTDWLQQGTLATTEANTIVPAPVLDEQRFLRFALNESTTALLPLDSIQEVTQIPQQGLLPVPEMPDAVLGVANCRGAILWLVELSKLLNLKVQSEVSPSRDSGLSTFSPPEISQRLAPNLFQTITIHAEGQSVGLVVPHVLDIEQHDIQTLQPPNGDLFPAQLVPFLAGYIDTSTSPVLSACALIEILQMQH